MSDNQPEFSRFVRSCALVLGLGIAAVVTFVVVVDPYALYGLKSAAGLNAVKPGLSRYQAEIKQVRAQRMNPDFVILGNSRAEIGFDPHASALKTAGERGFNLAIPGVGIDTSMRQMAQLRSAGVAPKTVIAGVEFLDFLSNKAVPSAHAAAPAMPASPSFWQFDVLFSLASVKDALRTLRIQHDGEAVTMAADGFNPLKEYRGYVRADGYYKIFQQRAEENARSFGRKSTTALSPGDMQQLHAFLPAASAGNADVRLVIYPYHAQILAMFEQAGLWPLFEEWKRQLVALIAAENRRNPQTRITLLDFSGFGAYNCEPIPGAGAGDPHAATQWYWEAGHFKKELGDIVLARVMAEPLAPAQASSFGTRLEAGTLQANTDRIAAERRACAVAQPGMFEAARKLVTQAAAG